MNRKFRFEIRNSKQGAPGFSLGYGVRVGYWPCLKAPYIQVAWHRWRLELWYGLPSYQDDERKIRDLSNALRDCVESLEYVNRHYPEVSGLLVRNERVHHAKKLLVDEVDDSCCTAINGSHTNRCEVGYNDERQKCWCCLGTFPTSWTCLWSSLGSRCFGCESHPRPCEANRGKMLDGLRAEEKLDLP